MKKVLIATVLSMGLALSVQAKDIVETAVAAGNFKTLATALGAAGLVDTLKGKGPFTVFAPTDEAFAKIPKADLDALLKDKAKLTSVLTYHVVTGKVMAADVKPGKVKTVQGSDLTITTNGDTLGRLGDLDLRLDRVAHTRGHYGSFRIQGKLPVPGIGR